MWEIQTDLALEQQERFQGSAGEIEGVLLKKGKSRKNGIFTTTIDIMNETGSRIMKKPVGRYLTLEFSRDSPKEAVSKAMEELLSGLLPKQAKTALAVGLGNADMTADALGPETVEKLLATRALSAEKEGIAAIAPGVLAQTGMESAEIIAGICGQIRPDVVVVIDALAARSSFRLGRTIQMTDTGIQPGSGIGNSRQQLNRETLGVPVIAVGVPTVVSAASIVCDALQAMEEVFRGQQMLGSLEELSEPEKRELVLELLMPRIGDLYVAPRDMDEMIGRMSVMMAEVLNRVLQ